MNEFDKVIETATKLKKVMQNKNLKAAKAKCPHCEEGTLTGYLVGSKLHLHMRCDSCSIFFME